MTNSTLPQQIRAVSLLRTWLDACSIPYQASDDALSVAKADGSLLPAVFNPQRVMSTDMDVAMGEFHGITKAAGYGEPKPVDRGAAPTKKRLFKDEILARWRHSEMRTVPNAHPEVLEVFAPIAKREANIFFGRNKFICSSMGYDLGVAYNDALVWTNTFLGRYQIRRDDAEQAESENKKLLTNYLRQRFVEVHKGLQRSRRNVEPDDAYLTHIREDGEAPSAEWKEEHDQIGFKSPALRRARVKELLNANFAKMGHDQMVAALLRTTEEHPCIDTRHAATRYLKDHAADCESCVEFRAVEDGEEVA